MESCQSGFFKSSINNKSCCALCPAGSFMKKECDGSMQTQCMACPVNTHTSSPNNQHSCDCPSDRYWHTILLRCMKCTNCEPGQKVIAPCEKEQDSRCESCNKVNIINFDYCIVTLPFLFTCSVTFFIFNCLSGNILAWKWMCSLQLLQRRRNRNGWVFCFTEHCLQESCLAATNKESTSQIFSTSQNS